MWFKKKVKARPEDKLKLPKDLWIKCDTCGEILYRKELEKNLWICPKCEFHFRINCRTYIDLLLDDAQFDEQDAQLEPADPLAFPEYKKKIKADQEKTSMKEAVVYGFAAIGGIPVVFTAMDFRFRGGSMGSVVGEKVARSIRAARAPIAWSACWSGTVSSKSSPTGYSSRVYSPEAPESLRIRVLSLLCSARSE